MIFSTTIDSGTVTLHITGELDAVSVPDLRPVLDDLISKGHKKIVVDLAAKGEASLMHWIDTSRIQLLPNTAGCFTARDAVRTAPAYKYRADKRWLNEAQQFLRTQA